MCTNTSQTTESGKLTSLESKSLQRDHQRPINRMYSFYYLYLVLTCVDYALLDIYVDRDYSG